jgi:hypothetical protein
VGGGSAGSERAGGAEWSHHAAEAGSVDGWIQGLRSGAGEEGGMAKPPKISTGELAESEADGRQAA